MNTTESQIRPAVAAGAFYAADATTLRGTVETLLAENDAIPQRFVGAMVPHAAYAFSGTCAARVYARMMIPRTVVLIGPDHFHAARQLEGASVWHTGGFATPLGDVRVDERFCAALLEICPLVVPDPAAHLHDHALEVQLPFLIVRAGVRRPAIVPILLRWDDWSRCAKLAAALVAVARESGPDHVLLLASSDMTHYRPAKEALRRDGPALAAMRNLDGERLLRVCREQGITMCGAAPAAVVLEAARRLGAQRATVVAHTHSGLAAGDDSNVVSYAGVVIR